MKKFKLTYSQSTIDNPIAVTYIIVIDGLNENDAIEKFTNENVNAKILSIVCINEYDSTVDTLLHIKRVNELMLTVSTELLRRATIHDNSKLVSPEKEIFDEMTPKLAGSTYGSDEYKQFLSDLKPALDNHYAKNSHHPEHYSNGIDGMNLFDLIEMALDWKAASERHKDGNIFKSIEINKKRFNMSDQLESIFINTFKNKPNM